MLEAMDVAFLSWLTSGYCDNGSSPCKRLSRIIIIILQTRHTRASLHCLKRRKAGLASGPEGHQDLTLWEYERNENKHRYNMLPTRNPMLQHCSKVFLTLSNTKSECCSYVKKCQLQKASNFKATVVCKLQLSLLSVQRAAGGAWPFPSPTSRPWADSHLFCQNGWPRIYGLST